MKNIGRWILAVTGIWLVQLLSAQQLPEIRMVDIPAGSFYMGGEGTGEDYDELPIHKVNITHPFKMSMTEITNAQFEAFRPEHKALRGKNGLSLEDDEAVVYVSYADAVAFCEWLSRKEGKHYRLPTEAEWEYACRAGTYYLYNTGDGLPEAYRKNQQTARDLKPVSLKVGQTPPNAFGLCDMHGNVEEWCLDWYGPYLPGEQNDPPDKYLRSGNRMAMIPEDKHAQTGFRIVESEFTPVATVAPALPPANQQEVNQTNYTWKVVKDPVFIREWFN